MVYNVLMTTLTAYTNNLHNWVVTSSSARPSNFRTHDILSGDGSSGRSSYCSKRRAFNRASAIIYCNKDILTTFVTLTYKKQHSNYNKVVVDLKNYFSRKGTQYLAVVEKHKSGNLHIHAITSDLSGIVSLRKGKFSWSEWKPGFSDVKFISGTDDKFRIEKYIFKYMTKSEKIGGRYFLKSRNLTVRRHSYPFGTAPIPILNDWRVDFSEYNIYTGNGYSITVGKDYYERQNFIKSKSNRGVFD